MAVNDGALTFARTHTQSSKAWLRQKDVLKIESQLANLHLQKHKKRS
jgi:hypothetical protein